MQMVEKYLAKLLPPTSSKQNKLASSSKEWESENIRYIMTTFQLKIKD